MDVLLIRHAIAEPKADEGGTQPDDRLRELTPKGRRRMKRAAKGILYLVPTIDVLAASPLVRAAQTAEVVSKTYDGFSITPVPELEPGVAPDVVVEWLRENETSGTVALVGHEPALSSLATYLATAHHHPFLTLDKGGACLLETPAGVPPGEGRFVWLATSKQLRALGRRR